MGALGKYRIDQALYRAGPIQVHRGRVGSDGPEVVLKVLKNPDTDPLKAGALEHEFRVLELLRDTPGVVAVRELIHDGSTMALVLDSSDAEALDNLWPMDGSAPLLELSTMAAAIARGLLAIHRAGIIHKDLNPHNIIWNPRDHRVEIIDFGISSLLAREHTEHGDEEFEGTLAYMAPEQSGRMNRGLDYRADLYSLGVTLYELATGALPFLAKDTLGWIHAHMSVRPTEPRTLRPDLPEAWAALLLKLLAKDPELRYQSVEGVLADLEQIGDRLRAGQTTEGFVVGLEDYSTRFQVPERLYGREVEVAKLLAAFERAATGPAEVVLVSGESGIGKSEVVNAIQRPIVGKRGLFATSKFGLAHQATPYESWVQLGRKLIEQLLTRTQEEFEALQRRLDKVLDSDQAACLAGLIPTFERLHPTPDTSLPLPGPAAKDRLHGALLAFLTAVATAARPLGLFIDDLHWADPGTLEFFRLLARVRPPHLLLIGAYRDDERSASLELALDELCKDEEVTTSLYLGPLDALDVRELLADTLRLRDDELSNTDETTEVAEILHERTGGNPFFLRSTLASLHREGMLRFDSSSRRWQLDLDAIREVQIAANVIELLIGSIENLPATTRDALQAAACVGPSFDLETLASLLGDSEFHVNEQLWPALDARLIVALSWRYCLVSEDTRVAEVHYRFRHDRIREAIAATLEEKARQTLHLRLGQQQRRGPRSCELAEYVAHMNEGRALLENAEDRIELAELNLEAATHAERLGALSAAATAIEISCELLPDDCWTSSYALSFSIYFTLMRASFFAGDRGRARQARAELLARAQAPLERAEVLHQSCAQHVVEGDVVEAVSVGLAGLRELGAPLPEQPSLPRILLEMARARRATSKTSPEALLELPRATDQRAELLSRIYTELAIPTFVSGNEALYGLILFCHVNLVVAHGHTCGAPFAYVLYGTVLRVQFGLLELGRSFGRLGLEILERLGPTSAGPQARYTFAYTLHHWSASYPECDAIVDVAIQAAIDQGNVPAIAYGHVIKAQLQWMVGGLDDAVPILERCVAACSRHPNERGYVLLALALVQDLRDETPKPGALIVEGLDLDTELPRWAADSYEIGVSTYHLFSLIALYHRGRYAEAFEHRGAVVVDALTTLPSERWFDLYSFLCAAELERRGPPSAPRRRLMRKLLAKFRRWREFSPDNFAFFETIALAERAWLRGQPDAGARYDEAIEAAKLSASPVYLALANERAGRWLLANERDFPAQSYLREAARWYAKWGAKAKLEQLRELCPDLDLLQPPDGTPSATVIRTRAHSSTDTQTRHGARRNLDQRTLLAAAEALAGEVVLADLLERMVDLAAENAGAERVSLALLDGEGQWFVEGQSNHGELAILGHLPVAAAPCICPAIFDYVLRSESELLLDDASSDLAFADDPYIVGAGVLSVLALPIHYQGELIAIFYLENNQVRGAFTSKRVQVLQLLLGQFATALRNARLVTELRDQEATWRSLVTQAPDLIALLDRDHRVLFSNRSHATGDHFPSLLCDPEEAESLRDALEQVRASLEPTACEFALPLTPRPGAEATKTSPTLRYRARLGPVRGGDDSERVIMIATDVTRQRELEHSLAQAQKMDAIGTMAGGIAHDFNNLLTAIIGSSELALLDLEDDHPARPQIDEVLLAGARAAALTRQLLTFSRKDTIQARAIDLNEVVRTQATLLERILGEDVRFEVQLTSSSIWAKLDPVHLEQIVLNLAVNARDAMPRGGQLTLRTLVGDHRELGLCALVQVSDTGHGIPVEVQAHMFEPFYTTKDIGKGTGLGLSTVHGVVERAGGRIEVDSVVAGASTDSGRAGTTFTIYLPRLEAEQDHVDEARERTVPNTSASELILVVEDEDAVRRIVVASLAQLGYRVLEASGPGAALELAAREGTTIDLLLTDVVMPEMSGDQVAAAILIDHPKARVLYMTGYTDDVVFGRTEVGADRAVLRKPFTQLELGAKISELLRG